MDINDNNGNTNKKSADIKKDKIGLTMDYDKEEFQKSLPHLASEIFEGASDSLFNPEKVVIDGIYPEDTDDDYEQIILDREAAREELPEELTNPGLTDFIRRCKTNEEAIEIIHYMLSRAEITQEEANSCKDKVLKHGVRVFGDLKGYGYYDKKYLRTTDYTGANKEKESNTKNQ